MGYYLLFTLRGNVSFWKRRKYGPGRTNSSRNGGEREGGRSAGEPAWCVGEGVRRQLPSGRKAVRAGVLSSGAE